MSMRGRNSGFTLIELIVTLAVAAIIIGLMIPSFQSVIRNNEMTTETNSLLSALQLARSEAVKRSDSVSVSAKGAGFGAGWCVHSGNSCTGKDDDNNSYLIKDFSEQPKSVFSSDVTSVTFNNRGELPVGAGTLTITVQPKDCAPGEANAAREITIGVNGHVRADRKECL